MRLPISLSALRITTAVASVLALLSTPISRAQAEGASEQALVIEDNDFLGPGGSDIQSVIPLLANPHIKVLGFTVSTGDDWENAESAHLRRFLEIAHKSDIPVADGAVYPLINTVALMKLREQEFGRIPWKGAWGGLGSIDKAAETQPALPKLPEGAPKTAAASESAALFMIRMVHEHPHQVTIFEAGPMTTIWPLPSGLTPRLQPQPNNLSSWGGCLTPT
jgi:inosine-uridine nucleoside N-ribohydrolase